jgi:glucosyl-dolichyl phosphate glucuronosyltransferase
MTHNNYPPKVEAAFSNQTATKKLSVIICTHNRADYLRKAIQSLLNQTIPRKDFEIVVVDNCSTDSTKDVVEQFASEGVQYLFEPQLGLSYARNAGWQKAKGKYIAYLDDDAVASSSWLATILATFEGIYPSPGCVGGKTQGIWEGDRPEWVSDELVTCLTVIDWSDTPHELKDLAQQWLVGANIAFLREALEKVGGFAAGLDRTGNKLLSGGDVFLQKQIQKAGYVCYYHPEILVGHHIQKTRLNQQWFVQRYFWQGVSDVMMDSIEYRLTRFRRLTRVSQKVAAILLSPQKMANLLLPRDTPKEFTQKCFTLIEIGHIYGLLGAVSNP